MSEFDRSRQPLDFNQGFDYLMAEASAAPGGYRSFTARPGENGEVNIRLYRLVEVQPERGMEPFDPTADLLPGIAATYLFERKQPDTDEVTYTTRQHSWSSHRTSYPLIGEPLNPATICRIMPSCATLPTHLEKIIDTLAGDPSIYAKLESAEVRGITMRLLRRIVALKDYGPESRAIPALLRLENTSTGHRITRGISVAFGELLKPTIKTTPEGRSVSFQFDDMRSATEAFEAMDDAGLSNEVFWHRYALATAASNPHLLPRLHRKLEANEINLRTAQRTENLINDFIVTRLSFLAEDESRNRKNVQYIRERTRHKGVEGTLNLHALISTSNELTFLLYNERLKIDPDAERPVRLAEDNLLNVSEALSRLLLLTRGTDLTPDQMAEQFEHDVIFCEIISLLYEQSAEDRLHQALGALMMQFPRATQAQVEAARNRLEQGEPIIQIIRTLS